MRRIATLLAVLAVGFAAGVVAGPALRAVGPEPSAATLPDRSGSGTLTDLPPQLEVTAETVRLGAGFAERHVHEGPTFNFIESGVVRITDDRGTTDYAAGGFFFEPADYTHGIEILSDARIDVLRLLPHGTEGTTQVTG